MPPPVHGAAVVGKYIHDSKLINNSFNCEYINFSLSGETKDVGKFNINKIIHYIRLLKSISYQLNKFKPDLCYVTPSASKSNIFHLLKDFLIIMLIKIFHVNLILHFHNKGIRTSQDKLIFNIFYKRLFSKVKVILLSDLLYDDIKKYVDRVNVHICPNGIPLKKCNKIAHKRFNILFLSNMMAAKGVWILLEACRFMKLREYDFECHFVGKWTDISEVKFKNRVERYDMANNVFYHGAKYGDEKNTFFANADLFAFPTYYEGETFGLVLLEAMQFSLPCISSCEGGIPDVIINGVTGFTIKNLDYLNLSEKLIFLLNNPEIRIKMGNAAKARFTEHYSLKIFEKNICAILKKNLNEKT